MNSDFQLSNVSTLLLIKRDIDEKGAKSYPETSLAVPGTGNPRKLTRQVRPHLINKLAFHLFVNWCQSEKSMSQVVASCWMSLNVR